MKALKYLWRIWQLVRQERRLLAWYSADWRTFVALEYKLADMWRGVFWRARRREGGHILDVWVCYLPCFPIHLHWEHGRPPGVPAPPILQGVPFSGLWPVPEPWPVRRWRGLWIYLRPWFRDVAADLRRMGADR